MKSINTFFCLLFISISFSAHGQYTLGGSIKNYERYKATLDSIVIEKQVLVDSDFPASTYSFFTIAFANATDELSRSSMTQQEYISSTYFAEPYANGKMGLKNGFAIGLNFQNPIKQINRNLIRNIDVGINSKIDFSMLRYNWRGIYTDDNYILYQVLDEAKYSNFWICRFGVGPSVTYIHNPDKPEFTIDAYARINFNYILGGDLDAEYLDGLTTYSLNVEREPSFNISPTLGINIRLKNFMIFIENNFGTTLNGLFDRGVVEENFIYNDYSSYSSTSSSLYISDLFKLNNFQIGIGLNLSTK